jgi:hypothetical protein
MNGSGTQFNMKYFHANLFYLQIEFAEGNFSTEPAEPGGNPLDQLFHS